MDPAGRHLATWIGDVANGNEVVAGMLSLFAVDASGRPSETLLDAAAAMPGFSLGRDRLAWSTPPGRNGQGSLVGVFAWSGAAPGAVYSAPDPAMGPGRRRPVAAPRPPLARPALCSRSPLVCPPVPAARGILRSSSLATL